jgi:uncharacterized protein (DUF305 family)
LAVLLGAVLGQVATAILQTRLPWIERQGPIGSAQPNKVDIGFAQFMTQHHDQAVTMSQILLTHPHSELRDLALSIQTAQALEMGQMRGWLQLWEKPGTPTTKSMDWMLAGAFSTEPAIVHYVAECGSERRMPGMATVDELNQLRASDGVAGDRLFLTLLIRHHQGALPMARVAVQSANIPAVQMLASHVLFDQTMELNQMRALLEEFDTHASDNSHKTKQ